MNTTWLTLVVMCLGGVGQAVGAEVPDLWQRRGGDDWPRFLGPNGDGTSGETGFFTATGLRGAKVLWSRRIGSGYAMPSIVEPDIIQFKKCEAKFVLHVEKGTVWNRFNEDRFWEKHNCILTHLLPLWSC